MDSSEAFLRHYGVRRVARAVMYLSLTAAGFLTLFIPFESIEAQMSKTALLLWSLSLGSSAAVCAWGSLTDRWIGEFTGLPLLSAVFFIHAIAVLVGAGSDNLPLSVYGLIIFALSSGLFARWRDVQAIKRANHPAVAGRRKG